MRFLAPYLKGEPTLFERKVKRHAVEVLAASNLSPAKVMLEPVVTVRTWRTSGQQNARWRNDKLYTGDVSRENFKMTIKEATQKFVNLKCGSIKETQQGTLVTLNNKYRLCIEDRNNTRENHMLAERTVQPYITANKIDVTPKKKGANTKISQEFIKLVTLHINMEQVGMQSMTKEYNELKEVYN